MVYQNIGLIGAMDEEIELFLSGIVDVEKTAKAGIVFYEGRLQKNRIVLCKSGVGKVNAAVCTQILIDRFQVEAVIFTGVAGAVDPKLNIGDVVVSTSCIQHDMDVSPLGFARGVIPFEDKSVFDADPRLADLAFKVSEQFFAGHTLRGIVLSGDQFIADRVKVQELYKEMNGACTEMEGAAVAQVCVKNNIPFVVIRSMSDKADGSAHVNFAEFTLQASRHSFQIVEGMLASLVN